ncbi:phosphoribosylanthranilate isomerase [Roseiarcaceae bacterium H3SJ34-1]|uniref:phosphoribosylanthranilate isomerase n=1 Tax=Terripilifer ovatus TaxID=3032367 RepID=UPI003AB97994|nr:phosphoribosylanthranilate isomerase [Roseiarcaceae bacterium H3SJ34-1]
MPTPLTVKICGLSTAPTLAAALNAGADMVGFVFFSPSPRHLSLETARTLSAQVGGRALKVALSVDADDALLDGIVAALAPDWLQLHGRETPERVSAIKARFGLPVMKALHISTRDDLAAIPAYDGVADRLMFDAKPPKGALLPGGNGAAFDWTILENLSLQAPWMLSGGLGPDNVGEALRITRAPGVDVSSGVERAPGVKDEGLIADFVARARAAVALLSLGSAANPA